MADYTLQEKESKVNGWVCVSIGTCVCVRVCAGICNKGGVNYYWKEKNQQFLVLLWFFLKEKPCKRCNLQTSLTALGQGKWRRVVAGAGYCGIYLNRKVVA